MATTTTPQATTPATTPTTALTPAAKRQAALAAQLPAGKVVQVATPPQATRKPTTTKGAPPVVARVRAGRPKPTPALLAIARTATMRKGAAPANTAAQAKQAAAYASAAQVVFLARRHNVVTLAGVHYHMRKVATGTWLAQVGKAPTIAGAPATAQGAPVVGKAANLLALVQVCAAHRATSAKGASKPTSTRKAAGKPKPTAQAPAQATAPVAPAQ